MLHIISVLSPLQKNAEIESYKTDLQDNKKVTGIVSCEGPIRYLVEKSINFKNKGIVIHLLVTTSARKSNALNPIIKLVEEYRNQGYKIQLDEMSVDDDFSIRLISDSIVKLFIEKVNPSDEVSFDVTGGMRNATNFIFILMQLLKLFEIKCNRCVYAKFNKINKEKNEIVNINDEFKMMDLVAGIQEFYTNGNTQQLMYFAKQSKISALEEYLNKVNYFISLITIRNYDVIDHDIKNLINATNQFLNTHKDNPIIWFVVNFIGKDILYLNVPDKNEQLIRLINWCLKKNLYMPAYVYYVEKMPRMFFEKKVFFYSSDILVSLTELLHKEELRDVEAIFIAEKLTSMLRCINEIQEQYIEINASNIKAAIRHIPSWEQAKPKTNEDPDFQNIKRFHFIKTQINKTEMCNVIKEYINIKYIRNYLAHGLNYEQDNKEDKIRIENVCRRIEIIEEGLRHIVEILYPKKMKEIFSYIPTVNLKKYKDFVVKEYKENSSNYNKIMLNRIRKGRR